MVPHDRIELPYPDYKTGVIPVYEKGKKWRRGRESNPPGIDRQSIALPEDYNGLFLCFFPENVSV